jgi:hypothetical protein
LRTSPQPALSLLSECTEPEFETLPCNPKMRHTINPKSKINGILLIIESRHVSTIINGRRSASARTKISGIVRERFV